MAKITPGAIISEISGSIANVTYSRSKYGAYSKAKLIQTNPNSPAQQAARAIAAAATAAWQVLAPEEQAAWNQFAVSQLSKPRLSLRSTLNGYNTFIRFYITRNTYGLSGNPDRVPQQPIGIYSAGQFILTPTAFTIGITGNNTNADIFVVVRVSVPVSAGKSTITQSLLTTLLTAQAPNGTVAVNLIAQYEAKYGPLAPHADEKIFIGLDIVNRVTAQKVAIFRASGIISPGIEAVLINDQVAPAAATTSLDGILWTDQVTPANGGYQAVAYSPSLNLWCAVSTNGSATDVMTSGDGITWTLRATPTGRNWFDIAWASGLNLFVAIAVGPSASEIMTSPDGINWTPQTSPIGLALQKITYSPALNLLAATSIIPSSQEIITSPDGINWTLRNTPAPHAWYNIAWAQNIGLFCAVALDFSLNDIMTSPDGINWTLRTSPPTTFWIGIAWSDPLNLFAVVGGNGGAQEAMTSPDGINWTLRNTPLGTQLIEIAWSTALGLFIAVSIGLTAQEVMTSPDGINWTLQNAPINKNFLYVGTRG